MLLTPSFLDTNRFLHGVANSLLRGGGREGGTVGMWADRAKSRLPVDKARSSSMRETMASVGDAGCCEEREEKRTAQGSEA